MISIIEILVALFGILIFGNLALSTSSYKKAFLAFNVLMLLTLAGADGYLLYTNTISSSLNLISINPFSLFFMLIFTVGVLLVDILAFQNLENYGNFALLSSFALMGMYSVSFAQSLITIFLGLELAAIPVVFIVLLQKRALEASTKLFIMVSIAIAILSFAIVLFYGSSDSLALSGYPQTSLLAFIAVLFVASLGFEASIFPFNILVPDIYQGAPGHVTALLGGISKKVGFAALLQVVILLFITYSFLFTVIAAFAVLTMFFGNIAALAQYNVKRMLAYSSISQAGYILIGLATASALGVSASMFQIFAHMLLFIGALAIISWMEGHNRKSIDDFVGLNNENRLAAFSLSLFMLSFIGLPFTTGFVGKFLLFTSAISANLTWLAIVGIVNTVISIYYYIKVILAMYATKVGAKEIKMQKSVSAVVLLCLIGTIMLGVVPQFMIQATDNAGAFLTSHPYANVASGNVVAQNNSTAYNNTSRISTITIVATQNVTIIPRTNSSSTVPAVSTLTTASTTSSVSSVPTSASTTTILKVTVTIHVLPESG